MAEDGDEGPSGVGGWLAFFLVVIGIFSPLRLAVELIGLQGDPELASAYGDRWTMVLAFNWVLAAVQLAICWFIAWRLMNVRNRQTVSMTIAGIWIVSLGGLAISYIVIAVIAQIPLVAMFAAGALDFVRALVFGAIWTAYFRLSKRVANTYRDRTGEEAAEIFS